MTWVGTKKLALVPVFRPNAHPADQIPPDWPNEILRRVLFDPDPMTGADRSLRTYILKASSGRADLDAVVMPRQDVDHQDVPPDFLEDQFGSQLRNQGFSLPHGLTGVVNSQSKFGQRASEAHPFLSHVVLIQY